MSMNDNKNSVSFPVPLPPAYGSSQSSRSWRTMGVVVLLSITSLLLMVVLTTPKRDAKNIQIAGNRASMVLDNRTITGQLTEEYTPAIMINSGTMTSLNTGNFAIISMTQVAELEKKYQKNFIYCLGDGVEEAKAAIRSITLIAQNQEAEKKLAGLMPLVKKGNLVVIEIKGHGLTNVTGVENGGSHRRVVYSGEAGNFFLLDDIAIIKEKYQ